MAFARLRKARNGQRGASGLLQRLSEAETREELRLTPEQIEVLDAIASGHPVRHSAAIIRAIETKLAYSQPKPKQQLEVDGEVGVTVVIRKESD